VFAYLAVIAYQQLYTLQYKNRLSWSGHITRAVNKAFDTGPEENRKIGRAKLRCGDGVIQDMRQDSGNRADWLKPLKKSRIHTGLSSQ
jgi:hypothetical protein